MNFHKRESYKIISRVKKGSKFTPCKNFPCLLFVWQHILLYWVDSFKKENASLILVILLFVWSLADRRDASNSLTATTISEIKIFHYSFRLSDSILDKLIECRYQGNVIFTIVRSYSIFLFFFWSGEGWYF